MTNHSNKPPKNTHPAPAHGHTTTKKDSAVVPSGRFARLSRLGALASSVAGSVMAEGAKQLAQGKRPKMSDLLLTPANARRVANQLAQLRGAAMKVGQLLSMDAGDMLPKELADILARLRSDAKSMPVGQLTQVLVKEWGKDWNSRFEQFSLAPIASASIGQVHRATTKDGRQLAIKIQYPGVRESIDSDIDNVASLFRMSGLIPKTLDVQPLLSEAKRQLHEEADYLREAECLTRYNAYLGQNDHFVMPAPHADLTTRNILAMSYVQGVPVESLETAPQAERDRIGALMFDLMYREIFEFRFIQTDPNFANYLYDPDGKRLVLLDFGAARDLPGPMVDNYARLMSATVRQQPDALVSAAQAIGYLPAEPSDKFRQAVINMATLTCEPIAHDSPFDFGHTDLPSRIREAGMVFTDREMWVIPPTDSLLLHRKLAGVFLLAARLKARVNVHQLAAKFFV